MAKFCVNCGTPLSTGPFCVKCGTDTRNAASTAPPVPQPAPPQIRELQPVAAPTTQYAAGPAPVPAKQGMSVLAKLGIAAVAIIFVGGAAGAVGVYYVAHRVSQKIHQAEDRMLGSDSGSSTSLHGQGSGYGQSGSKRSESGTIADVCHLLSKQDVSQAVGVEIVQTHSEDNGCAYMAKGTQEEMAARHTKAMVADVGGTKETQDIAQKVAGGMFNLFQTEKPASEQDTSGEVPVFSFSVDQNLAEEQMRLNRKVFANLGPQQGLPGIGDEAFMSSDGVIFVRKGKSFVRILYLSCPCGTEAVKPLAKKLADSL